jgi:hypothetical protein
MMSYQDQLRQNPSAGEGRPPVHVQAQPTAKSIASMVLGLLSIACGWTFLVPIIGLILGFVGLKREPAGRGMAITA